MDKETMLGRLLSVLVSLPVSKLGTLVDLARKLTSKKGDKTHELLKKMLRGELVVSESVHAVEEGKTITRRIKVDLSRSPQDCLKATGRNLYADDEVVANMPKGKSDKVEVVFFKVGCYIDDDQLEKEYEERGLVPVDPYSLSAVNEADQTFADKYPNGTQWKDSNGKWCCIAFNYWNDGRDVSVCWCEDDWDDRWWFSGLRK